MPRTISSAFGTYLQNPSVELCGLLRVQRKDGTIKTLTDWDKEVVFGSETYLPNPGIRLTNVQTSSGLSVDSLSLSGFYDDNGFTRSDLLAGLYEGATFVLYTVRPTSVDTHYAIDRSGSLGKTKMLDSQFEIEVLGLIEHLQYELGEFVSPQCRANLGDERCKVNLQYFLAVGVTLTITSNNFFTAELHDVASGSPHEGTWSVAGSDWFTFGVLTFDSQADSNQTFTNPTTGNQRNHGISFTVQKYDVDDSGDPTFRLSKNAPFVIDSGDLFYVYAGCDWNRSTCNGKFDNAINFQGEPDVPGEDKVISGGG